MIETKHDISDIVCGYTGKRWDDLVAPVESLRQQQTLPTSEIINVIDHNPSLLKPIEEIKYWR